MNPKTSAELAPPMSFFAAARWTLGASLFVSLLAGLVDSLRPGSLNDLVSLSACHALAYSAALLVILQMYARSSSGRQLLGLTRPRPLDLLAALLVGAGSAPLLNALGDAWVAKLDTVDDATDQADQAILSHVAGGRFTLVLILGLLLPLVSEIFVRGAVYGGLRRGRTSGMCIVATAVFFGSTYSAALPMWLVLGLGLAWLREATGNVWASLVARVAFASVPLVPLFLGRSLDDDFVYPRWVWGASVAALALGLLFIKWTSVRRSPVVPST
jgi:membrane protease YdiL (CAAX protease family)